jgi:aromatic-L-amino-acid/L-tryptophan decarboxylase
MDPHKWLFAPFDCAALLYRNPSVARSVHKQDASYLDVIHDRAGEWNPTDYAYHLTRRARGLPLWFSLSVYGVDAYTEAIETAIGLARQTAEEIRGRANLELIREPELGVVLFRRRGWEAGQYTAWADQLLQDQVAFIPPSAWEGETVARFAFLHPQTSMELVREILDRMELSCSARPQATPAYWPVIGCGSGACSSPAASVRSRSRSRSVGHIGLP